MQPSVQRRVYSGPPTERPRWMEDYNCGLARVTRQASEYPDAFKGYSPHHCKDVNDVPKGQVVFCLPFVPEDIGWRAIIVIILFDNQASRSSYEAARLTWIHPECLEFLDPDLEPGIACVDHVGCRGRFMPSIHIWNDDTPGVKEIIAPDAMYHNELLLDARWVEHFPKESHECSGHCFCWCRSVLQNPICTAQIMRFAQALRDRQWGRVCCDRGKHRSVSSANILMLLFNVKVEFKNAVRDHSDRCCGCRAVGNAEGLFTALRGLPKISGHVSRPLAEILRLPESGDVRRRKK